MVSMVGQSSARHLCARPTKLGDCCKSFPGTDIALILRSLDLRIRAAMRSDCAHSGSATEFRLQQVARFPPMSGKNTVQRAEELDVVRLQSTALTS